MSKLNPAWLACRHAQEHGPNIYRYPSYLPHAGSGNMGVRRAVHESVGGFDESIPYLFDTDFCFKAQLAGRKIHFAPGAVLHYRMPPDLGTIWRKAGMNGQYNVLLYKRYRGLGMPKLPLRTGLAAWRHMLTGVIGLRSRADLAQWLWGLAWRLGRVKGCLKYRTLAL
jgi:GT2 family glycosyltransferase